MIRIYTGQDSREVRTLFFSAIKKQGGDKRKMIVTEKEFEKYKKTGADMNRFETMKAFQKRVRNEKCPF